MVARVDHKAALAGLAGQPAHGGVEDAPVAALCAHPDLYRLSAVWMLAGRLERLLSVEYVLGMLRPVNSPGAYPSTRSVDGLPYRSTPLSSTTTM